MLAFVARTMVMLVVSVPLAAVGILPAFFATLLSMNDPRVNANLDIFLTPLLTALTGAGLAGAIVSCGERWRTTSRQHQRRAMWACLVLGSALGLATYAVLGWAMPLALRAPLFPAGPSSTQALEVHPFLLTSPELFEVQRAFRGAGGFSVRVAQTLELRLWLALSVPVWALLGAVAMLVGRPRPRLARLLLIAGAAFGFVLLACLLAIGPGYTLRPPRLPMFVAWGLLSVVSAASAWWMRRRGRDDTRPAAPVTLALNDSSTSPS